MSSSSDSDEGRERYTYVIGRTDAQAWEDDLVPYLRRRYQADEARQKMDIITRIRGVRKGEIRKWEEWPHAY